MKRSLREKTISVIVMNFLIHLLKSEDRS